MKYERGELRRIVAGAGLIGYTALGIVYGIRHNPPPNLRPPAKATDCRRYETATDEGYVCQGAINMITADRSSLTNHGSFRHIDNLVDNHIDLADDSATLTAVLGIGLVTGGIIRCYRPERPKTRLRSLFIQRGLVPLQQRWQVEGHGYIPLLALGTENEPLDPQMLTEVRD